MRILNSSLYPAVWVLLYLVPVITTGSSVNTWDISPWYLVAVSTWYIAFAACLLGRSLFLLITFPIVLAGIMVVAGDLLRNVNLIEFISFSDTFSTEEIVVSIAPYRYWIILVILALGFIALGVWVSSAEQKYDRRKNLVMLAFGVALVLYLPASSWVRAWPASILSVAFAQQVDNQSLLASLFPDAAVNPREGAVAWDAERASVIDESELYVLVIGESVRPDRMAECGGRKGMHSIDPDSIVYCDVLSGSSSTYTSVPLLISRDNPGLDRRISKDASFISAFGQLGFSTYWLSSQELSIAWPDAEHQKIGSGQLDEDRLMPLVEQALSSAASKKLLVLHAYNAHFHYIDRYRQDEAVFPVKVNLRNEIPSRAHLDQWWNAYDNAVNESMKFLDILITRLKAESGRVFLMYTSDHGENMLDDDRDLTDHALTFPTRWDVTVPTVIWSNQRWRENNTGKHEFLQRNLQRPLMHLDLVPTLLGAADIVYRDERSLPVDLTSEVVGKRERIVQKRLGEVISENEL